MIRVRLPVSGIDRPSRGYLVSGAQSPSTVLSAAAGLSIAVTLNAGEAIVNRASIS
jgi:hypothetical protein